ncbi:MAG: hypothetical protein QME96_02775 [Myxococcota bacterium]|nr:hypothetical protein [Myxococcota bacterium]
MIDPRPATRDPRPPIGDPGVVLIIAMLVVLGLSLLGAVVLDVTRVDTATSGHLRRAEQTDYISEAALMLAIREWGMNHSIWSRDMVKTSRMDYTFNLAAFNSGAVRVLEPGDMATPGSLGFSALSPDFTALIDRAYNQGAARHYSIPGTEGESLCFRRYTFTAAGEVGMAGPAAGDSTTLMRATAVVGPTPCKKW